MKYIIYTSTLRQLPPRVLQPLFHKASSPAMQLFSATSLTRLIVQLVAFVAFVTVATAVAIPAEDVAPSRLVKRGRCGIHVTQYQSAPSVAVIVKNSDNGAQIGQIGRTKFNNGYVNVFSQLRYSIVIHLVGGGELNFAYAADSWSTTDGRCSVGRYDYGVRQMDCGFAC